MNFQKFTSRLIVLLITIVVFGVAGFFIYNSFFRPAQQMVKEKVVGKSDLFGTMGAFTINNAAMSTPGMLDAIGQKGWTEFRKDNLAYQNLLSNLKKLIQDRTKFVEETGFFVDREIPSYFTWNIIEPQKGQFDWELTDIYVKGVSNAGIKIFAIIQPFAGWDQKNTQTNKEALDFAYHDYKAGPPKDIAEYENFLTKTVERYKDKVAVWEIGNEPENPGGGYQNNPEGYFDLVKITSETIKKIDPEAKVTNGGAMEIVGKRESDLFKAFWTKFFALGGGQYLDYFNVHYNIERSPDSKLDPDTFEKNLMAFNNLMDENGGKKPLYITEFGIYSGSPSFQPFGQFAQGPQNDNTYFAISSDSKNWQPGSLVAKQASVPDVIQLKKDLGNFKNDDLLVYFVDFSNFSQPGLGLIISHDGGKTWNNRTSINLVNLVNLNKGAVDPSIVQLDDGKLRLYFFGSEIIDGDPALVRGSHKVYSAISSDGINFTVENGIRFQDDKLTDPEVLQYKDQWFMYYSVGTVTKLAVSNDGLNFSAYAITGGDIGGVPGAVIFDGSIRLFACGKGIVTAVASNGINFNKEQEDIFNGKIQGIVCDPSVARMDNDEYAMVYKIREEQLSSQSPQQIVLPTQLSGDKCGDGICDDFEKQNSNVCPKDCQIGIQQTTQQPQSEKSIPNQSLPKVSQEFQAALYFKDSIIAFASGVNTIFIDMVGPDDNIVGSSMAFNTEGQSRLFLTTLKTIASKISGFSKVEKIADSQYKFTVGNKIIYALWSGTLPKEISGKVKVTDMKGQERFMDTTEIKLKADQPVLIEL